FGFVGSLRPIGSLEGLARGPSVRVVAQLFNNFSTDVEKFRSLKVLTGRHFARRRAMRVGILCQPNLLSTRYGAGPASTGTSRASVKTGTAKSSPRDTTTRAGTIPGNGRALHLKNQCRSDIGALDLLFVSGAHYSTASHDDVNTHFPFRGKNFRSLMPLGRRTL